MGMVPMNEREHRTIGNGVVIAYSALLATMGAMVVFAGFSQLAAVGLGVCVFAVLFAGDMWLQREDMEDEQ